MGAGRSAGGSDDPPVLTRAELCAQLEERLHGRISERVLAGWAFDRFYEEDMGELVLEPGAEEELRDVLDTLMFADDEAFALDAPALNALLARLRP
jgi:hypothetical protein